MKVLSTHDQIFLHMSGTFLTKHLPPEYLEWAENGEEDKMEKFFLDHVLEEYEYWPWTNVLDKICQVTEVAHNFLEPKPWYIAECKKILEKINEKG